MIKKIRTSLLPFALLLALLAGLLAGCARGGSSAGTAGGNTGSGAPGLTDIVVRASTVAAGPLGVEHRASGTVKPVMQSQVASQVGGIVAKVLLKAGDWVEEGGQVILLDDSQLQLSAKTAEAALANAKITLATAQDTTTQASPKLDYQLRSAQAALSGAQRSYDSKKALVAQGGATNAELDQATSVLQSAQANLEAAKTGLDQNQKAEVQNIAQLRLAVEQAGYALQQARLNLEHASIKAPYPGRVVAINPMPGEFVGPNAPAFVLASDEREIAFSVPPSDAGSLSLGSLIDFTLGGVTSRLTISRSPRVPVNGVVPFVASVAHSLALPFGSVGTVSYSLVLASGTLIPTGAIQTTEDQNYAFVIEGSKAIARKITILAESGDSAAITGVEPGSVVIVNPPPGLMDGSGVKALTTTEAGK